MIELRDISFEYAARSAMGTSFRLVLPHLRIAAGERVACIGPSGSGKTTLINLIAGITTPQRGAVVVDGVTVSALDDRRRRTFRHATIGMVFQEFELLEYLSARDNILLPVLVHAGVDRASSDTATTLARSLGIAHLLSRKPRHLSHGERQRVGICRALVTRPRVLLCDEPTGNLDQDATMVSLALLMEQANAHGVTMVMVTHNLDLLSRFDRVIDMRSLRPADREANGDSL